jgi:RNA polymerase sigma-70 factor (ECF subfamily)
MRKQKKSKAQQIFEEELFPHMEALKTFAYHLTYNEDDADDLVQETYLKAHKFLENYHSGTNAKAWLFKILKNAYINEFRRKRRQPKRVDFENAVNFLEDQENNNRKIQDSTEAFYESELGDEVTLALNSLPQEFHEVIFLCDVEGFSYEEIAEITGLPIGTVRSRLFRARNALKEKLKSYAQHFGYEDKRGKRQIERKDTSNPNP